MKTKIVLIKGDYSDQQIIQFINKWIKDNKKKKEFSIFLFKSFGKSLQKELKERDVDYKDVLYIYENTKIDIEFSFLLNE